MLTNKLMVVCEKVIFAQQSLMPSLINLFTKLTVAVPIAAEIPRNAVAPKEWVVFSQWDTERGDETREYIVCTHVLYPDQSSWGEVNRTKIDIVEGRPTSVYTQMVGFPIGQAGMYTVRVWIEENQRLVVNPLELRIELELAREQPPQ